MQFELERAIKLVCFTTDKTSEDIFKVHPSASALNPGEGGGMGGRLPYSIYGVLIVPFRG